MGNLGDTTRWDGVTDRYQEVDHGHLDQGSLKSLRRARLVGDGEAEVGNGLDVAVAEVAIADAAGAANLTSGEGADQAPRAAVRRTEKAVKKNEVVAEVGTGAAIGGRGNKEADLPPPPGRHRPLIARDPQLRLQIKNQNSRLRNYQPRCLLFSQNRSARSRRSNGNEP